MIKIQYGCRWENVVEEAINKLGGGKEILRVEYEADYQGFLDIDVLLEDNRIFSYTYYYGSCSVCDPWENDYTSDYKKLIELIITEATIFDSIEEYQDWRKMVVKETQNGK